MKFNKSESEIVVILHLTAKLLSDYYVLPINIICNHVHGANV